MSNEILDSLLKEKQEKQENYEKEKAAREEKMTFY